MWLIEYSTSRCISASSSALRLSSVGNVSNLKMQHVHPSSPNFLISRSIIFTAPPLYPPPKIAKWFKWWYLSSLASPTIRQHRRKHLQFIKLHSIVVLFHRFIFWLEFMIFVPERWTETSKHAHNTCVKFAMSPRTTGVKHHFFHSRRSNSSLSMVAFPKVTMYHHRGDIVSVRRSQMPISK